MVDTNTLEERAQAGDAEAIAIMATKLRQADALITKMSEALREFINYDAEAEGDVSLFDCERVWKKTEAAIASADTIGTIPAIALDENLISDKVSASHCFKDSDMTQQYAPRDIRALDRQGNFYCLHVSAMTAEKLCDKSDIAAELAQRDYEKDVLLRHLEALMQDMRQLTVHTEGQICLHETTHRGGAIWEICDECGAQWADDRGGKPEFVEPKALQRAHEALSVSQSVLDRFR